MRLTVQGIRKYEIGTAAFENAKLERVGHGASNKSFRKWAIGKFAAAKLRIEEAKDRALSFELEEGLSVEKKETSAAPQVTDVTTPTPLSVSNERPAGLPGGTSTSSNLAAANPVTSSSDSQVSAVRAPPYGYSNSNRLGIDRRWQ